MRHLNLRLWWLLALLGLNACATLPAGQERQVEELREDAREALERGDNASALALLRQSNQLLPEDTETLALMMRLFRSSGNEEGEVAAALQLLSLEPDNARALERMGLLTLRQGRPYLAADYLRRATGADDSLWMAWNGLGIVNDAESEHELAQTHFRRSLEILPGNPKVLANLGWSLLLNGDPEQAETYLRQSLQVDPEVEVTRSNLAYAIALQGRYEEARRMYRELYDEAVTANNLGYAALQRNEEQRAREYLQQAIRLRPSFYERAATSLEQLQSPGEASSLFRLP